MREGNIVLNNPYRICACLSVEIRLLCHIAGLKGDSGQAESASAELLLFVSTQQVPLFRNKAFKIRSCKYIQTSSEWN